MYIFKKSLPLLIIYSAVVLLYFPSLTTYFSHDDFFHFKISMTDGSLGQFVNFFGFHPFNERLIAFYRPIFREVLYNTFYNLFGLNQLPFRLLSFAIHFINIYLVFNLMQLLFKKKFISYFASFGGGHARDDPPHGSGGGRALRRGVARQLILLSII